MNEKTEIQAIIVSKIELDNNTAKKIAEFVAGKVPTVGGVLSQLISMFWPNTEVSLWDQIKEQVEALISQKIAEYNLKQLELTLQGIHNDLDTYLIQTDPKQKLIQIQAIDVIIQNHLPRFVSGEPSSAFSTFWAFALLHLSVRKEIYFLLQDEANLKLLKSSVMVYCTYARVALSRSYNDYLDAVAIEAISENEAGKVSNWQISVSMTDTKAGKNLFSFNKQYRRKEWDENVLNERTVFCNNEISGKWDNLLADLKSQMSDWAFNAILELEQTFPFKPEDGLKELKKFMEKGDAKLFDSNYCTSQSIFYTPVAGKSAKPSRVKPVVKLNPFKKNTKSLPE
ncbi:delta endotoxin, N-terminal domain [Pseudarcicella hirudinis]|uniref:Delta endotoxin, N-terminal domain n=1 Tax=Pseudarcicella hirudinis TaxID=1079859 RepID=A0A1I5VBT3_9BACT|nr:insecticidal delta-endotoxin Cry8Ea1 family protein [Pseudarcicella hirudinis]SFQ04861.1 delta endotoxin, N-terminal domain [Pseudarcicella hirudinis]